MSVGKLSKSSGWGNKWRWRTAKAAFTKLVSPRRGAREVRQLSRTNLAIKGKKKSERLQDGVKAQLTISTP
jgi:hypothetical protein